MNSIYVDKYDAEKIDLSLNATALKDDWTIKPLRSKHQCNRVKGTRKYKKKKKR